MTDASQYLPTDPRSHLDESDPLSVMFHHAGQEGLDLMLATFGGRDLYFPKRIGAADKLPKLFGLELALELARLFGGERINIPTTVLTPRVVQLKARLAAIRRDNRHLTITKVAELAGCSERQAYRYLAKDRAASDD